MIIYEVKEQFDRNTGKPTKPRKVYSHCRCDFCGDVILDESDAYPSYGLDYASTDACMGSSAEEFELARDFGIDMYEFLYVPYTFCRAWSEGDKFCEPVMLKKFLNETYDGHAPYDVIADMFRMARTTIARKLIEEGIIKPEQLSKD